LEEEMKISILGCGNWGSVFGIIQHRNGHSIKIWEFDKKRAQQVKETRNNEPFLVGYKIPKEILIDYDIKKILDDVDVLVFAVPSQVLSEVVAIVKEVNRNCDYFLSLVKGIEIKTLRRPSEIINILPQANGRTYVLSGPCIANEIIRGEPTAAVLVGPGKTGTKELQYQLSTDYFRIYQGDDLIGVELGAAIKNIIALACGISDGLGFGTNAKGALIARGIVEMQRLGIKMGAEAKTFWGLSGLGDLVTTSFSEESRNHRLGRKIGGGRSIEQACSEMVMVAEGFPTSDAVKRLANQYNIEMPICEVVYEILFHKKSPQDGIRDLMTRPLKNE
jgi:glycerol-3-phosphate dehydrogenase (NAD(P)+)